MFGNLSEYLKMCVEENISPVLSSDDCKKIITSLEKTEIPIKMKVHETGAILCERCGSIAFDGNDTPKWMTSGHCFRCGQLLRWKW